MVLYIPGAAMTGDVTSNGDGVTAIAPGAIVNADVNAAAAIDASKIGTGVVSNAEFGYLDGVTSAIQTQLNAKLSTASYTAADVLAKLKTVDGAGSGLDAALFNGLTPADFVRSDAAFIELRNGSTTAGAAYFDFHTSGNGNDFDSRIIAEGGTAAGGQGKISIFASEVLIYGREGVSLAKTTDQSISTYTETKVLFETTSLDSLGEVTSSRFTAKTKGRFLIVAQVSFSTVAAGAIMEVSIRINNSETKRTRSLAASVVAGQTRECIAIENMNIGDYVEIFAYYSSSGSGSQISWNSTLQIQKV